MRQIKTKQLLEYWLTLFRECNASKSAPKAPLWPDRRSIQPAHCRSLLSEMFILESLGGPYYYRLAGTKLCELYDRELKREEFSKAFIGADREAAETWVSRLTPDAQVVLICSVAEIENRGKINLETLLLPLSNSSGTGRRVLGITVPQEIGNMGQKGGIVAQAIRSVRVLRPWEQQPTSSWPDYKMSGDDFSSALGGRIDMAAPPLSPQSNKIFTADETNGPIHQYKRVGHLLVIDGGRDV